MYISLDAYRVFYYVAQYGSFTHAADMLYSNQPNVTRTIKNLEQELGCVLFVRSRRGVQLTHEGEALLAHIAPAMEQIQAGEEALLLHTSLKGGVITIGASEVALEHTLLPVLKQFRHGYPDVHLRILNSTTPQAVAALRDRTVELALITGPADANGEYEVKDSAEKVTFTNGIATITINGTASAVYGDNAHVRGNSNNLYFNSTGAIKNVYIRRVC